MGKAAAVLRTQPRLDDVVVQPLGTAASLVSAPPTVGADSATAVPAFMRLAGRWNWSMPGRLDRLLPRLEH